MLQSIAEGIRPAEGTTSAKLIYHLMTLKPLRELAAADDNKVGRENHREILSLVTP
jgi:hypothetical protein